MKRAFCLALLFIAASSAFGQKADLTQQDIDTAATMGKAAKRGQQFCAKVRAVYGGRFPRPEGEIGICSPIAWIELQSNLAAIEYKDYVPTDDDRKPVLHVSVEPPTFYPSTGLPYCENVNRVVLKNLYKDIVIQPATETPFDRAWHNQMGGSVSCKGQLVTFQMSDLQRVRPSQPVEFLIVVVSTAGEKEVRIKPKDLERLP